MNEVTKAECQYQPNLKAERMTVVASMPGFDFAPNGDDAIAVPRALLELCEVLLHEGYGRAAAPEMIDGYSLTLAQLRAFLKPAT